MGDEEVKVEDEKESLARAQLPYRAEYCKTGRAKCKKCEQPMAANSLKLAKMTKSRFHDGYDASYHHVTCFFQIKRPASVAEIRHFETLKYEDQKMLEKAVETKGLSVLGTNVVIEDNGDKGKSGKSSKMSSSKKRSKKTEERDGTVLVNYDDFSIEYAKSGRAKCNSCEEKIDKDSVRLGKLDYDAETHWKAGPVMRWYHVNCFVKSMEQLEFYGQVDKIKAFEDLEEDDQKMLKKKIKPIKPNLSKDENSSTGGGKKIKIDKEAESDRAEEERLLKEQSDRFFALREFVNTMKRKDIETMLRSMDQKSDFKASSMLVDMATDVLLFGSLNRCPLCKKSGGILLRGSSYICTKGMSESEPCSYETREPKRDMPDVPDEIVEKYYDFFENYKFIGGKRIFPSKFIKAVEQKEAEDNNIVQEGAPLDGTSIGVISWKGVKTDKTKVQKKIITLGGKIQTALDRTLFVIITSKDELDKDNPKIEVANALGVPFATEEFLFKIEKKEDVVPQLSKCLLVKWDGDLQARFNKINVK